MTGKVSPRCTDRQDIGMGKSVEGKWIYYWERRINGGIQTGDYDKVAALAQHTPARIL